MTKRDGDSASNKVNKWQIVFAFVVLMAIFYLIQMVFDPKPNPYRHPSFVAAPYIASPGCENRRYNTYRDYISLACADKRYLLDQWREYGLPSPGRMGTDEGRKVGTYYRVGDDLVGMSTCYKSKCVVRAVEYDVYKDSRADVEGIGK